MFIKVMYPLPYFYMMQNISGFMILRLQSVQEHHGEDYSAPYKMNRTGVAVVAKDNGVKSGIHLRNLYIHDVNGNVYDKHMNNGGIYMTALKPANEEATGVARLKML